MIYNAERAAAMQNLKGIVEAMPGVSLIDFNPRWRCRVLRVARLLML
jgi:hypothetical protein